MRCADTTRVSKGIPNSSRMATALRMTSQSLEEPMMMPTTGAALSCAALEVSRDISFKTPYESAWILLSGLQAHQHFLVLGSRLFQHGCWRTRCRRCLVPVLRFEPVANELLVERRRVLALFVLIRRPEARRVWCQHFVHQVQHTIVVQAELK